MRVRFARPPGTVLAVPPEHRSPVSPARPSAEDGLRSGSTSFQTFAYHRLLQFIQLKKEEKVIRKPFHTEVIEIAEYEQLRFTHLHGNPTAAIRDTQDRTWHLPDPSGGPIMSRYDYEEGMRVTVVGLTIQDNGILLAHTASVHEMAAA